MSHGWIKERFLRDGVVSERTIEDGAITADKLAETGAVQTAVVTVTTGQLLALNATPKTLVAAPGAGRALIFEGAQLFLDYNSAAYAGIAAGEDLAIKYTDASGAQVAEIETTGFLDQTSDQYRWAYPVGAAGAALASVAPVANAPLVLHMLTGEVITGNSPLIVRVHYRDVALAVA